MIMDVKKRHLVKFGFFISVFILLSLLLSNITAFANIEETIIASGKHGIDWKLTDEGILHLGGGNLSAPSGTTTLSSKYPWTDYRNHIRRIVIEEPITLPTRPALFKDLIQLEAIENIDLLDLANVRDMSYMFDYAKKLKEIDLSSWDVSKVTDMSYMFRYAESLNGLDLSSWDVSKVTNMQRMFSYAENLQELSISNWKVSNVTNMGSMFFSAGSLYELDLSGWCVSNVTNMSSMFGIASKLESLNLSGWESSPK